MSKIVECDRCLSRGQISQLKIELWHGTAKDKQKWMPDLCINCAREWFEACDDFMLEKGNDHIPT